MLLAGSGAKKNVAKNIIKKYGTLIAGTIIEFIFGIDFLPIETCIVIIVYWLILVERKQEQEAEQTEQQANYA